MNGQHFNSSGSGNDTPTPPSNSSYPASLSSQSSRDPSPQSRDIGMLKYDYLSHEQKSSQQMLVNNISNSDVAKQPLQSAIYSQKPFQYQQQQQHYVNNTTVKSPHGFSNNHNSNSTNLTSSSFNSSTNTAQFTSPNSGMKYNSLSQNSNYNPTMFPDVQNALSNQNTPSKTPYQINATEFNSSTLQKPIETKPSTFNQPSHFPATTLSQNSSQQMNVLPPPVSQSSNVNLLNSSDDAVKQQPVLNFNNAPSPQYVNPNSHSGSHSSLMNRSEQSPINSDRTPTASFMPSSQNIFPAMSSVSHQPHQASALHQPQQAQKNLILGDSSPASAAADTTAPGQQVLLNQPQISGTNAHSFSHKEQTLKDAIGSDSQITKTLDPSSMSQDQLQRKQPQGSFQPLNRLPGQQLPPTSQPIGQHSNSALAQPLSNAGQPRPINSGPPHGSVPTSAPTNLQAKASLSQSNINQQYPPSSIGHNVAATGQVHQNRLPPPSQSTFNPALNVRGSFPPPTSLSNQQVPLASSGPYQQRPPTSTGQYQPMQATNFGSYQQKPPPPTSGVGLQQMPTAGHGQPPVGPYQQIPPPTGFPGSSHQMPPLPATQRSFQPPLQPPPTSNVQKTSPYHQPNQFQQHPPLPNQYPQYPQQNAPIQSQPGSTGLPYGVNRYPQMAQPNSGPVMDGLVNQLRGTSVTQDGFNKLWGMDTYDLLRTRDLLPKERVEAPQVRLNPEMFETCNCSPELFRCTLTKVPETKALLDKSRLPFGVLIHPFKDLNQLSVVQCSTIVRCRSCRTYINPFVYFVDNKRWKCNLCFRVNELPDEFQFDPLSKTYGDPSRRPEIKFATIEFIAPSEYMVRPPQPAIYLFLFDVSRLGAESGYLEVVCQTILEELENLPGDARTSVGFITYDSSVHFYSLAEGLSQPHEMIIVDIEDMFLPCPDNLLVNLNECHDLIKDLLHQLPNKYSESYVTESALGAALQAAYKLLSPTGGRITVFQSRLPSIGPGSLSVREDPSQRAGDSVPHLNPITDFYKKLALDCSTQQIAVDLFVVNSQYVDVATLSGISRFSGGCMYHFPLFRLSNALQVDSLKRTFQRYLTRKIGFESVMRLRCTRGLSIHTFHGNFFVRSTDLLSLPNINPDAGFGMQVSIDESLAELHNVCFQAALLYTSSKGERRIRVHTLCLPVATNLSDILNGADQQCIVGLLAKMAVDRSIESSVIDAREAFVNVVADIMSAYKLTQNSGPSGCLLAPKSLRLVPLYVLALLKSVAFRTGQSTRLDDRVFAMCQMKSLPLSLMLQFIYPDLYPIHTLLQSLQKPLSEMGDSSQVMKRLHLSSEHLDSTGVFLLDNGTVLYLYVGHNVNPSLCQNLFGVPHFTALPQEMYDLPELDTLESERLRDFIYLIQSEKPVPSCLQIIRDDSPHRGKFLEYFIEDKNEAGTSYHEFLQRIKVLMK